VYLVGVEEENERLKKERDRLARELSDAQEMMAENTRLKTLLGFSKEHGHGFVGARVIAVGADPIMRTVRIDRGRSDGMREYQPVVSSSGVVGRILNAAEGYSDVLLITDRNSAVAVLVGKARARATLVGAGEDGEPLSAEYLSRRTRVDVGDRVITSGLDGVFPKGLPVGRVAWFDKPDHGLFQEAGIEAAVDLDALEEVLVLVGEEVGP